MKNKRTSLLFCALTAIIIFSLVFGIFSGASGAVVGSLIESEDIEISDLTSWSKSEEGGESVYTAKTTHQTAVLDYTLDRVNSVEFDMRYNSYDNVEGSSGISVISSKGRNFYFDYRANANSARLRINDAWTIYPVLTDFKIAPKADEWIHWQVIWNSSTIYLRVNGITVMEYFYALENENFNDPELKLGEWMQKMSVKNIKVSRYEIQEAAIPEWSVPDVWSKKSENATEVYTNTAGLGSIKRVADDKGSYNTFTFKGRINTLLSQSDANLGAVVYLNETDNWFFEYNPAPNRSYARLRYFDKDHAVEGTECSRKNIEIAPLDEWVELKIVFMDDYLVFYINGEFVLSYFDTQGFDLSEAYVGISTWNTKASVKDLSVSTTEKDLSNVGYLDLEFKNSVGTEVFESENADIGYKDGCFSLAIKGNSASMTSPRINVGMGTPYSMRLSVRNTFAVRLKNNSSADRLKVNFVTSTDENYDLAKEKTFAIDKNSDFKTYYFNISDVYDCGHWENRADCKKCNDYLRGFKFTFEGADSGEILIDAITFERESRIYEKAATELYCTASNENKTVTVKGKVLTKYAGKTVTVYRTDVENYNELLNYKKNEKVGEATVGSDGSFEVTFSLIRKGNVNHLSSLFLAEVDGNKLSDAFRIENWRDFTENPYEFTLPNFSVSVTDDMFGAKGDGFTNDNKAIQAAIDYVSGMGGGTVVVPGDDSEYGRRYIVSQLNLKDNINLCIEKGAILWQSQRFEDYDYGDYEPVYGHDVVIPGAAWTHAAPCWNLPLLYFNEVKNVKVTGGGEIRMQDTGGEWLDGNGYSWDSDITANCSSLIHIHPVGVWNSDNIEITDITVKRGAIWHFPTDFSRNVYYGNVNLTEVSCINGDGFGISGSKNVVIDRCFLYSNDDAVTISASYDDPRGYGHAWHKSLPGEEYAARHVVVKNSNLFGGHGITFIPWGSADPCADNMEIYDICVYNNVLGGTSTSVGCWPDNPYYGSSGLGTYDQREKNDYSAMRDIYIYDNIYTNATLLATWAGDPPEIAKVTNSYTDCGIFSSNEFINGAFDRSIRYQRERNWTSGTTYWSRTIGEGGSVGTVKIGTKEGKIYGTNTKITQDNYAGFIKGNAELYQGLYLKSSGKYKFTLDVKLDGASAVIFARDMLTGDIIASLEINESTEDFKSLALEFEIAEKKNVQLGVMNSGADGDTVYIDNADIKRVGGVTPAPSVTTAAQTTTSRNPDVTSAESTVTESGITTTVDNIGEKNRSMLPALLIGAAAVAAIGALAAVLIIKKKKI